MTTHNVDIIATVESPYKERFGIPRQPGLVNATGQILFNKGYDDPDMLEGLAEFSHIWVTFIFHANADEGWNTKVRPPRLGSKQKVGVYASRSPYRPNFIGQSALKLEAVHQTKPVHLQVSGLDLLDGTPIIDIKPYVTYTDAIADAKSGFANDRPAATQQVIFSQAAKKVLSAQKDEQLIRDVLTLDPRPAYKQGKQENREYGMQLGHYEVKWVVDGGQTTVVALYPLN